MADQKQQFVLRSDDIFVNGVKVDSISPGGCTSFTFDLKMAKRFSSKEEALSWRDAHRGCKSFGASLAI